MSACCRPSEYGKIFSSRTARHDARRYRRRGLRSTAADLAGWLRPRSTGATVLEVGGGVGALQLELLRNGAERAVNVELSPEYEPEAQALAAESGVAGRVERRIADFVTGPEPGPADLVVLHRVVCCYPDMPAMVHRAAAVTRRALALTYPVDRWWVRLSFRIGNVGMRLWRKEFRAYVHPPERIHAAAGEHGLRETLRTTGLLWESVLLERPAA